IVMVLIRVLMLESKSSRLSVLRKCGSYVIHRERQGLVSWLKFRMICSCYIFCMGCSFFFFFFQAEDGIRDGHVTGVQTCALPIYWRKDCYRTARLCSTCCRNTLCPADSTQSRRSIWHCEDSIRHWGRWSAP